MSEIVVVGSFTARPGKEAEGLERVEDLFGDSGSITVYEPRPGGDPVKGSLADHARLSTA